MTSVEDINGKNENKESHYFPRKTLQFTKENPRRQDDGKDIKKIKTVYERRNNNSNQDMYYSKMYYTPSMNKENIYFFNEIQEYLPTDFCAIYLFRAWYLSYHSDANTQKMFSKCEISLLKTTIEFCIHSICQCSSSNNNTKTDTKNNCFMCGFLPKDIQIVMVEINQLSHIERVILCMFSVKVVLDLEYEYIGSVMNFERYQKFINFIFEMWERDENRKKQYLNPRGERFVKLRYCAALFLLFMLDISKTFEYPFGVCSSNNNQRNETFHWHNSDAKLLYYVQMGLNRTIDVYDDFKPMCLS